jgi:hypothetical protein
MASFPCPCCGHLTLGEPPGSCDICQVCFWEDDISQLRFPLMAGGANKPSLLEAQANYRAFGSCERRMLEHCRAPKLDEAVEEGWRPVDRTSDNPEVPTAGVDYNGTYPADSTALYYWRSTYWRRAR